MTKEFEFYLKADLKEHRGKYVVIVDEKIVASGDTAKIWEEVKERFPNKKPLLVKVPRDELLVLKLRWK